MCSMYTICSYQHVFSQDLNNELFLYFDSNSIEIWAHQLTDSKSSNDSAQTNDEPIQLRLFNSLRPIDAYIRP